MPKSLLPIALMLWAVNSSAGNAISESEFPRTWEGIFRWHKIFGDQLVDVVIDTLLIKGPQISAKGKGRFLVGEDTTNIQVEWLIDTNTLFIEMWETAPPDDETGFVTDGSYKGSISNDFKTIFAIWKTNGTDETATLSLKAKDQER